MGGAQYSGGKYYRAVPKIVVKTVIQFVPLDQIVAWGRIAAAAFVLSPGFMKIGTALHQQEKLILKILHI